MFLITIGSITEGNGRLEFFVLFFYLPLLHFLLIAQNAANKSRSWACHQCKASPANARSQAYFLECCGCRLFVFQGFMRFFKVFLNFRHRFWCLLQLLRVAPHVFKNHVPNFPAYLGMSLF